jgi:hypothetical protein
VTCRRVPGCTELNRRRGTEGSNPSPSSEESILTSVFARRCGSNSEQISSSSPNCRHQDPDEKHYQQGQHDFPNHITGVIATIAIPNPIMQTGTNVLLPRSMRACSFSSRSARGRDTVFCFSSSTTPSVPLCSANHNAQPETIIVVTREDIPPPYGVDLLLLERSG